ncbi:MFS transporter [Lentilactobacillus sp. SPB1-3]|uniref:MFS transporter n=1 Tax=Lentilactobacillus terminaliae TaxID=3003483 RepID=A0ACD5DE16_9LACO|nr:MFS transporter [Lentilactobacillus sp. SPB1-3]MCZ0977714.1 MFS transporter [Lentilactobacillus sp. SPB1-3]
MEQSEKTSAKSWWVLVAVCLGVFMSLLDVTVVNVALPSIQKNFNTSFSNLQWIINAYTLVYAVMLLLVSKLGDLFGRKLMFNITLTIFTLGSLACSMATSNLMLVIFRGVQALGGAGLMSLSMSIVAATFSGKARGLALGVWGSVADLSTALGPLVGGILVQAFNWRAIFLVNVPVGVLALIMSIAFIRESEKIHNESIDFLGMLISTVMVFLLILGLIQKENHYDYSWTNWHVSSLIIGGIVLIIVFIVLESKLKNPMIDLSIFKNRGFVGSCIAAFALGGGLYAFFTYLTILLQNYMGYSALQTGIRQLLISGFSLVLVPVAGMLSDRIKPKYMISGSLIVAGCGMLIAHTTLGFSATWTVLIPAFILFGISNALVNPSISNAAVSSVLPQQIGMSSGVVNVFRQFGTSFGVVILGLTLTDAYHSHITSGLNKITQLPAHAKDGLTKGLFAAGPFSGKAVLNSPRAQELHQLPFFDKISDVVTHAYYYGMHNVLLTCATLFIAAGVICFFLFESKKRVD